MGKDNEGKEVIVGKQEMGNINVNSPKLELGLMNSLIIGGTLFKHDIHKTIWISQRGTNQNLVDHMMIEQYEEISYKMYEG